MRAVIQRVDRAKVSIGGRVHSEIGKGLLILIAVSVNDTEDEAEWMAAKCAQMRIFNDDEGKLNRSVEEIGGELLIISQFTLYGNARKGRRPSFVKAAPPEKGKLLYLKYVDSLVSRGLVVKTGVFGAMMKVELINDGPVTIILEK